MGFVCVALKGLSHGSIRISYLTALLTLGLLTIAIMIAINSHVIKVKNVMVTANINENSEPQVVACKTQPTPEVVCKTKCVNDKIEINIDPRDIVGDMDTIVKTLKFMLKNSAEDDPEFVDFVRTIIKPPSKLPINLVNKGRTDFSQIGQSKVMDEVLKSKRNGFFVEAGGLDGESFSNSLFFELERNWTGILIEPIVPLYNTLVAKNRNIYSINACIAGNRPFIGKLRMAGALSGRIGEMSDQHLERINNENKIEDEAYVYVPCLPLYTILKAININTVDYFSLDVEGGEYEVLKGIPYDKIDIRSFTIEWPASPQTAEPIKKLLRQNDYKLFKEDGSDYYMFKM